MWLIIPIIIPFGLISRSYRKAKNSIRRRRHRGVERHMADDRHHTVMY
jgi:hypothetical protein